MRSPCFRVEVKHKKGRSGVDVGVKKVPFGKKGRNGKGGFEQEKVFLNMQEGRFWWE